MSLSGPGAWVAMSDSRVPFWGCQWAASGAMRAINGREEEISHVPVTPVTPAPQGKEKHPLGESRPACSIRPRRRRAARSACSRGSTPWGRGTPGGGAPLAPLPAPSPGGVRAIFSRRLESPTGHAPPGSRHLQERCFPVAESPGGPLSGAGSQPTITRGAWSGGPPAVRTP